MFALVAMVAPGEAEVDPGMQLVKEIFHRGKISSNNILRVFCPEPDGATKAEVEEVATAFARE